MPEVKLNLIPSEGPEIPCKPGDARIIRAKEGHLSLVWVCPKCGQLVSTADGHKHVYNPETKSLTPSIVCAKEKGGCGYHGFLTNGIFNEC